MGKPSIIYTENKLINDVVSKPLVGGNAIITKKEKLKINKEIIEVFRS